MVDRCGDSNKKPLPIPGSTGSAGNGGNCARTRYPAPRPSSACSAFPIKPGHFRVAACGSRSRPSRPKASSRIPARRNVFSDTFCAIEAGCGGCSLSCTCLYLRSDVNSLKPPTPFHKPPDLRPEGAVAVPNWRSRPASQSLAAHQKSKELMSPQRGLITAPEVAHHESAATRRFADHRNKLGDRSRQWRASS